MKPVSGPNVEMKVLNKVGAPVKPLASADRPMSAFKGAAKKVIAAKKVVVAASTNIEKRFGPPKSAKHGSFITHCCAGVQSKPLCMDYGVPFRT